MDRYTSSTVWTGVGIQYMMIYKCIYTLSFCLYVGLHLASMVHEYMVTGDPSIMVLLHSN